MIFVRFFMMDVEFMMKMISDKEKIHKFNQRMFDKHISIIKRIIKNIGSSIQAIELNADLGTQSGPVINPELHTELCLPYLKKLCEFIHKESDYKNNNAQLRFS